MHLKGHISVISLLLLCCLFAVSCNKEDDEFSNTMYEKAEGTESIENIGYEITKPTFGAPVVVMASDDDESTQHDNAYLGFSSIIQVQPFLYYLYYESIGNHSFGGTHELSFAYSTDGFHWKREIPEGIEEPVPETNLIFDWRTDKSRVVGLDVVKVMDQDYPFRMIACKGTEPMLETINMWKSKDGIHFEQRRELLHAKHDTQVSIIVRGNILKVYLRMRKNGGDTTRQIGVMYTDLDGNILSPPTTLFGDGYYQAAASIIDDRRELLLPTFFDEKNDNNWYDAYIVDGTKITHIDTNIDEVLRTSNKDGWGTVCPKIITIGFEQYIYYVQRNYTHGDKLIGNETKKRVEIRCSKITWDTKGKPYRQF